MPIDAPRAMTAHNTLHSLLVQATSAEYIALCLQAYQLARHVLLERLAQRTYRKPVVIFDLDETVFDNSPYQAWLLKAGTNFHPLTWNAWCNEASAGAVPGAVEFVRFAANDGATPIFITTRDNLTRAATARNLAAFGLLSATECTAEESIAADQAAGKDVSSHAFQTRLFMKPMPDVTVGRPESAITYRLLNKFLQRMFVEQVREHEVILSLGDNLADYAEYYGGPSDENGLPLMGAPYPTAAARRTAVHQDSQLFGRDFILIPNATYGGWLQAFEANGLGASDELANTNAPVRQSLAEPQAPFIYEDVQSKIATATAKGPKLTCAALRIWAGPKSA
jgi:predicted secreted acid phosphatase